VAGQGTVDTSHVTSERASATRWLVQAYWPSHGTLEECAVGRPVVFGVSRRKWPARGHAPDIVAYRSEVIPRSAASVDLSRLV
jgi:hypothetical protein